jgi:hypothetical protein
LFLKAMVGEVGVSVDKWAAIRCGCRHAFVPTESSGPAPDLFLL